VSGVSAAKNRRRSASRRRCPVSSSRHWRRQSRRCRPETAGSTRSSSTAIASRSTWPTRRSRSSPAEATTGRTVSRRSPTTLAYQGELNRRGRRDRRAGRRRHDDFSVLQNELKGKSKSIVLVAFDLLYLNGRDLRKLPLYAGKVDHGFDKKSAADLQKRLKPLIRKTQPYAKRIAHKGAWVEPKQLAEIEYRAKSAEGKVRHQFFRGLREDL
jgi:ATP dependent DNA ligase-like protein